MPARLPDALRSRHIPSLDGLRAVSALLVVFDHYGFTWAPGGLGVLTFFVLSGFLITWLLLKEEQRFGRVSLKRFYIRRSLRIFPAFYFYWLLLIGLLLFLHKPIHITQALCSLFYVNNYYQAIFGDPNTGLSHTWSLGVEEQFYLFWPFLFLLLGKNRARMRFLALAIVIIWLYREVLVFAVHRNQGYIYEAFDTRADHLLIGCLLAVALFEGAAGTVWSRLCASPLLAWITVGLLSISVAIAIHSSATYRDAIGFVIDPLLVAALIVQTVAWADSGLGVLLNLRWVRYLGAISYSIYLYQQLVIPPVKKIAASLPAASLFAVLATVIAAASASYWIVEKPFLRIKDRFGAGALAAVSVTNSGENNYRSAFDPEHRRH